MSILINDSSLTREVKAEVRNSCDKIVQDLSNRGYKYESEVIFEKLCEISRSRQYVVRELSNYLFAIYEYLDLENKTEFPTKNERILLASLIYFALVDDVIPDHIAYIGFLDDAYCVNYALSKQSRVIKNKIEKVAKMVDVIQE